MLKEDQLLIKRYSTTGMGDEIAVLSIRSQTKTFLIQCILDYPAMLGNLFPKSWPDKKSIYRRVPTAHRPPPTTHLKEPKEKRTKKRN